MDQERSGAAAIGRWAGWLVVLALTVAVAVLTVAVVGQVTSRPLTRAAALPSAAPTTTALPGQPLPEVAGRPVAEAQPALEQTGAVVKLLDAGGQDRPVQPDWVVCTAGAPDAADAPTGEVHVAAVPAGDACT